MRRLRTEIQDRGGPEYICGRIADGERIGDIAKDFDISRRMLYMWRDKIDRENGNRALKEMWEEAVALSAEADVERSLENFDRLDRVVEVVTDEDGNVIDHVRRIPDSAEVTLATGRAKFNQWLAARKDPQKYGDRTRVDVTHNLGDLHLQALEDAKRLNRPTTEAETAEENQEAQEADYEIVDG